MTTGHGKRGSGSRLEQRHSPSLNSSYAQPEPGDPMHDAMQTRVALDMGWGRLIFAHTFPKGEEVVDCLREEEEGARDIAFYLRDPHVLLSMAPQELFLDPSHTYRLWLTTYRPSGKRRREGFIVRRMHESDDAEGVNRIYAASRMVQVPPSFFHRKRNDRTLSYYVAEDRATGEIIGTVTGVDHHRAFNDPENGSSLWCLAVDPQASHPGIGEELVRTLAEHYQARGRAFMDLSVMHDNTHAIALYEKLGFERVPVFTLKTKNAINEKLFIGPAPTADFNPYAMLLINEARRRGIVAEPIDPENGYFRLSHGGRSIICRESLTELTSAIAMSRCDDKVVTRRVLQSAGLRVPEQIAAGDMEASRAFMERHGSVVVKPARGEQGRGISVDVRTADALERAVEAARQHAENVVLEQYVEGQDLRIIVIDFRVVAAAVRRPAEIFGDGQHTVKDLIEKQSRRRAAATGGESHIPVDDETLRCIQAAGYGMDSVLPQGETLLVRKTANLHTGGTIHDVTDRLSWTLVDAAVEAARALDIPVVGLDFLVPAVDGDEYVIIEANERPGLANHEPQPTAERFIDLLFPHSMPM